MYNFSFDIAIYFLLKLQVKIIYGFNSSFTSLTISENFILITLVDVWVLVLELS